MTPEKIASVAQGYLMTFEERGIAARRMDTRKSLKEATPEEKLTHARFLTEGVVGFANDPDTLGKANRHLSFVQAMLSEAGWYTIDDLMSHNRPDRPT